MTKIDMGNGEILVIGIAKVSESGEPRWCALTLSESKTFKTERGATKWLEKRGYRPDGSRIK